MRPDPRRSDFADGTLWRRKTRRETTVPRYPSSGHSSQFAGEVNPEEIHILMTFLRSESYGVEDRHGRLTPERWVKEETTDHALVEDARSSWGQPQIVDADPRVGRVIVDLFLSWSAQRLYL